MKAPNGMSLPPSIFSYFTEPRSTTQGSDPLINGQPFTSYSQQPQGSGDIPNEFIYPEEANNSTTKELPTVSDPVSTAQQENGLSN